MATLIHATPMTRARPGTCRWEATFGLVLLRMLSYSIDRVSRAKQMRNSKSACPEPRLSPAHLRARVVRALWDGPLSSNEDPAALR